MELGLQRDCVLGEHRGGVARFRAMARSLPTPSNVFQFEES